MGSHKKEVCKKGLHLLLGTNLVFNGEGLRECRRCRYDRTNRIRREKRNDTNSSSNSELQDGAIAK
jgi:hypothetical protein